jgi:hypothetical protein
MRGAVFLFAVLARRAAAVHSGIGPRGSIVRKFFNTEAERGSLRAVEKKSMALRAKRVQARVRYQPLRSTPSRSKAVRLRILR